METHRFYCATISDYYIFTYIKYSVRITTSSLNFTVLSLSILLLFSLSLLWPSVSHPLCPLSVLFLHFLSSPSTTLLALFSVCFFPSSTLVLPLSSASLFHLHLLFFFYLSSTSSTLCFPRVTGQFLPSSPLITVCQDLAYWGLHLWHYSCPLCNRVPLVRDTDFQVGMPSCAPPAFMFICPCMSWFTYTYDGWYCYSHHFVALRALVNSIRRTRSNYFFIPPCLYFAYHCLRYLYVIEYW